jgi:hypothetical protein
MKPGEVGSLRGDRTASMLTPSVVVTDRYQEQDLECAAGKVGAERVTSQQTNFANTKRVRNGEEPWRLDDGQNPWKANLGRGFEMK